MKKKGSIFVLSFFCILWSKFLEKSTLMRKKRAKMHSFPKNVIKIKMQKNSLLYKMI